MRVGSAFLELAARLPDGDADPGALLHLQPFPVLLMGAHVAEGGGGADETVRRTYLFIAMYNVHPHFSGKMKNGCIFSAPKLSGKNLFILIF